MKIKPKEVTQAETVFCSRVNELLPDMVGIPEEFQKKYNKWNTIVSTWFFRGLSKETQFIPKEGIDPQAALDHVTAIMRSFEPKHEHKMAGCAYLLSLWFEDIILK